MFHVGLRELMDREEFFYNAFYALSLNGISGDYAEFGSHQGITFGLAYDHSRRSKTEVTLWSFDSFQGLPSQAGEEDAHPHWIEGSMTTSLEEFHAICKANGVPRSAYQVVPGFYDQTLPSMPLEEGPQDICLAYVDCDLYSSTKAVLDFLAPRLKHGMIVAFDDYFCWSSAQLSGERKAMLEFLSEQGQWDFVPYIQYGWGGQSFVVEARSLQP